VTTALVAIASAVGALARYAIGRAVGVRSFPWATLGINLTGSFLLGLVLALGVQRDWPDTTTIPLAVGFLGAYTTFSTFPTRPSRCCARIVSRRPWSTSGSPWSEACLPRQPGTPPPAAWREPAADAGRRASSSGKHGHGRLTWLRPVASGVSCCAAYNR
jgi:hypothetical protein